MDSKLKDIFWT
jgi:hypothetical protein